MLFSQASHHEKIDVIENDLASLQSAIEGSENFRNFLKNTSYGRAEQKEVIGTISKDFDSVTNNFIGRLNRRAIGEQKAVLVR